MCVICVMVITIPFFCNDFKMSFSFFLCITPYSIISILSSFNFIVWFFFSLMQGYQQLFPRLYAIKLSINKNQHYLFWWKKKIKPGWLAPPPQAQTPPLPLAAKCIWVTISLTSRLVLPCVTEKQSSAFVANCKRRKTAERRAGWSEVSALEKHVEPELTESSRLSVRLARPR